MLTHAPQSTKPQKLHWVLSFIIISIIVLLQGCAPRGVKVESHPVDAPPLPTTTLYFYPTKGQSKEQQTRDRYECYRWAVKQTGFDPGQVPDPTDEDNLEIPSGRGLMLMRSYMSSVRFNDAGNCVTMEKSRSPESDGEDYEDDDEDDD